LILYDKFLGLEQRITSQNQEKLFFQLSTPYFISENHLSESGKITFSDSAVFGTAPLILPEKR
jgi:hypothetical protein